MRVNPRCTSIVLPAFCHEMKNPLGILTEQCEAIVLASGPQKRIPQSYLRALSNMSLKTRMRLIWINKWNDYCIFDCENVTFPSSHLRTCGVNKALFLAIHLLIEDNLEHLSETAQGKRNNLGLSFCDVTIELHLQCLKKTFFLYPSSLTPLSSSALILNSCIFVIIIQTPSQ